MTSKAGPSTKNSGEDSVKCLNVSVVKKIDYPPPDKADKILEKLHMRRQDGEFCDVQLKLSNSKTVYAHKAVLATSSPFFEGMFMSSFKEASSDLVDLSHITDRADVMEKVIDTFYGRKFEINEENISDTINLATMLLLEDMKSECAQVLLGIAHVRNAAEMLQISINFDLKELKEKVFPIIMSRFHDYILFQDDLFDLSVEGFEQLILNVNTSYIATKSKYVQFILRWFSICESDERAKMLNEAVKRIRFRITKHAYREFEEQLEDVINHLDDANSDVSEKLKEKLRKILPVLKPNDYIKNMSPKPILMVNNLEDSDSDLEDEPKRDKYITSGANLRVLGPPTKKVGFSKEEKAIWKKAHEDMAERDQHRIWAAKWPPDPFNQLGTHNDPNRPKRIIRESPPDIFRSRKRRVKSDEELTEEANLIETIVVLAPSNTYLKKMESDNTETSDCIEDMLDVCAYIPRRRAWFKITSLSTTSLQKSFSKTRTHGKVASFQRRRRPDDSDDDSDDDDEDVIRYAEMMDMYGPEMPEMVMMRGMPSSRRRRLVEEAMRGRMPQSMLRRMMEMDMDDEDFHRHEYLMMREMSRVHPRHRAPFSMMHMMQSRHNQNKPSLTDPKWNAVYLKHRLYFYHQDLREVVFCYDIQKQSWHKSNIDYTSDKNDPGLFDVKDGIELILMGQILHAVLRITVFDRRHECRYRSKDEQTEESKRQEVIVKHAVFKMVGELCDARWEKIMETSGNHEYIPVDKELREDPERERHGYPFMDYSEIGSVLRQPGGLKTILYVADEEKLFVCTAVRKRYYKDESIVGYCISHIDAMYLDLKETDSFLNSPDRQMFLRTLTPLFGDDLLALLNDDLKHEGMLDLGSPGIRNKVWDWGSSEPEKKSEYLDARSVYPRCPSILFSAGDGKSLWILRGKGDDTGETLEVYATMSYQKKTCQLNTELHPPPPFRCFTIATAGKMHKTLLKALNLPTKYLHSD